MRRLRLTARVWILTFVATAASLGTQAARAIFTSATGATVTVASATMPGPGAPSAEQVNCRRGGGQVEIELQWSATSASYATAYTIERAAAGSSNYSPLATLPIGTLAYIDASASLNTTTTYSYRVSATYRSWSASSPAASVTTANKQCH